MCTSAICEMSDYRVPAPIEKIHMPPDRGPGFWWGLWDPLASLLIQAHCPNWDLWVWWHPGSKPAGGGGGGVVGSG